MWGKEPSQKKIGAGIGTCSVEECGNDMGALVARLLYTAFSFRFRKPLGAGRWALAEMVDMHM